MNTDTKTVKFTVTLDEAHAWHLAQFLKRVSFSACERLSDPTDLREPHFMLSALETVRASLAEQGVSPR
jgi:hypothetical protein